MYVLQFTLSGSNVGSKPPRCQSLCHWRDCRAEEEEEEEEEGEGDGNEQAVDYFDVCVLKGFRRALFQRQRRNKR